MFWNRKKAEPQGKVSAENPCGLPAKKIKIIGSDFRDGQQSLFATRFRTGDILPVLPQMDLLGYDAMEVWGGATFDVCIRYLGDDPWERLRLIKERLPHTRTMMLLRGQNLVGYRQYPDDIVEKFVELAARNGMDIFVVFDGLNDPRNCETAFRAVKKSGKMCCASITYTVSPIHNTEKLVETARAYQSMGAESIYLADMAGLLTPQEAYRSVKALRDAVNLPVWISCHATSGMAQNAYWEAIRAGADDITCCMSGLSGGASAPAIETMAAMLKGTSADTGLDLERMSEINRYIMGLREKYKEYLSRFTGVDANVLRHQIPGGMLSNLESQLREMKAIDRLDEVFAEAQVVRKDMGYPPLATPFSQMVGAQAVCNILMGRRYGMLSREVRDYVRGAYGKAPGSVSEELKKAVLADGREMVTVRPGSLLVPEWEKMCGEARAFASCEEDVMTYALFPVVAKEFLTRKNAQGVR